MTKERKPRDFDWVTARHGCSASAIFERLAAQARVNVETRKQLAKANGEPLHSIEFVEASSRAFAVTASALDLDRKRVVIRLGEDPDTIYATRADGQQISGAVALGDDGECRLRVGRDELDEWQFLNSLLEPVLFPKSEV